MHFCEWLMIGGLLLRYMRRATVLLVAILMLVTSMAGCLEETLSSNSPPTTKMSVSPSGTLKVGDSVQFDATGSSDPNGDPLTFEWEFGDGNTGTGQTVNHIYNSQGTFTAKLCVSDNEFEICEEKTLTVAAADAALPTASVIHYKDNDCTGEEPPAGTMILAWICEEEMDTSDDSVDTKTTIQLDGSDSSAGDSSSYLTDFEWDLDIHDDSDGDGDSSNDVDLTGETTEWTNVWPGEYEIRLTVTDNNGFTDTMNIDVYVNYRGHWAEFTIGSNSSNNDPTITIDYPVTYNSETKNTIRYVKIQFTYPKLDDDWALGTCTESNAACHNRLDVYIFNGSESSSNTEEVINSTYIDDEQRVAEPCSDDDRCVDLRLSTQHFRNYLDGTWRVDLENEKQHDTTVKSFVIILEYK